MNNHLRVYFERCQRSPACPLVVLGSTVNALSFVRSLGRNGVPVLCADVKRRQAGCSRFGAFYELSPESGDRIPGEAAADVLFKRLDEHKNGYVVLGASDGWQVYLSQRTEHSAFGFTSLLPSKSVIDMIVDKQAQYEFAVTQGVAVPNFANAGTVMRGEQVWTDFPAIVKPRWSHEGREAIGGKALIAQDAPALGSALQAIEGNAAVDDYIVQRVVRGGDDQLFAYLACYDSSGSEFSCLVKRKLRQHPAQFGDGTYDVTLKDEAVIEMGRKLLFGLGYCGLVGVEFKRDAESGELELIEINPRAVSTNQIAITAGVDFPWHCYCLAAHAAGLAGVSVPDAPSTYREGVYHVHEERELRAFRHRWKQGELGLKEWVASLLRARSFAMWDWRDPMPFLRWLGATIGNSMRASTKHEVVQPRLVASDPTVRPHLQPHES